MTGPFAPSRPAVRAGLAVGWTAALVGLVWGLHRLGGGPLSVPPVLDPARLDQWLAERDIATVAFALVRLVALALGWYLLAVTVLGGLARASRIPRLIALADVVTLPLARRVLGTVAGVGLTTSAASLMAVPVLGGGGRPAPATGQTVTLERLADGSSVGLRRLPDSGPDPDTATMRVDDGPDATLRVDPGDPATMHTEPGSSDSPTPPRSTWTVAAGDSFWSVADAVLAERWGRPPGDAELLPYWHLLIETNRLLLVQPDNPDLIYEGQVLDLPPAPPPP